MIMASTTRPKSCEALICCGRGGGFEPIQFNSIQSTRRSRRNLFSLKPLLLCLLSLQCDGFVHRPIPQRRRRLCGGGGGGGGGGRDDDLRPSPDIVAAARSPLLYEKLRSQAAAPVLDLSLRRESMQDIGAVLFDDAADAAELDDALEGWEDGRVWAETRAGLAQELGIGEDDDALGRLPEALPQLLRLEPSQVLAAARAALTIVGGADGILILNEPGLLGFRADDLTEGERHLATMMAMPPPLVRGTIRMEPKLLTAAVEASLQERAVEAALDSASSATSNAFGRVVGEASAAANAAARGRRKGPPAGSM
jgi:hypothetical protein